MNEIVWSLCMLAIVQSEILILLLRWLYFLSYTRNQSPSQGSWEMISSSSTFNIFLASGWISGFILAVDPYLSTDRRNEWRNQSINQIDVKIPLGWSLTARSSAQLWLLVESRAYGLECHRHRYEGQILPLVDQPAFVGRQPRGLWLHQHSQLETPEAAFFLLYCQQVNHLPKMSRNGPVTSSTIVPIIRVVLATSDWRKYTTTNLDDVTGFWLSLCIIHSPKYSNQDASSNLVFGDGPLHYSPT